LQLAWINWFFDASLASRFVFLCGNPGCSLTHPHTCACTTCVIRASSLIDGSGGLYVHHSAHTQWRTQKVFVGVFIQWLMVVICIWCALFVTSQFEVTFIFSNQRFGEVCWYNMHPLLRHAFPYFMFHCTEYKLSALRIRISEENKLNVTTQQFITAKITGCTLKQGSKTNSTLRQKQLQNQAALMSCRIQTVKHRKCAAGLAGAHPGLQDRIVLNYSTQELRMRIKYARKLSIFCYV